MPEEDLSFQKPEEAAQHLLNVLLACLRHGYGKIEVECKRAGSKRQDILVGYGSTERYRITRMALEEIKDWRVVTDS